MTRINRNFDTIAHAEAASGIDNEVVYVVETDTSYRYEATGSAYTRDGTVVLNTAEAGNTRWLAVAGKYCVNLPIYSTRNHVINGGMEIDQRNGGAKKIASSAGYTYGVDRFCSYGDLNRTSTQRLALASSDSPFLIGGLKYYLRLNKEDATSLSVTTFIAQQIEGQQISSLNFGVSSNKNITVSFWAKASGSYNFSLSLANSGSGATRTYVVPFNVTTAWQKYSFQIPVDITGTWATDSSCGLSLRFVVDGNVTTSTFNQWKGDNNYVGGSTQFMTLAQNSYLDITGVQLNEGSIAAPFERAGGTIGGEDILCKRYCWVPVSTGDSTCSYRACSYSGGVLIYQISLPVPMRDKPALTSSGTEVTDWAVDSIAQTPQSGFTLSSYANGSSKTLACLLSNKTSHGLTDGFLSINTAKVVLSAEL